MRNIDERMHTAANNDVAEMKSLKTQKSVNTIDFFLPDHHDSIP